MNAAERIWDYLRLEHALEPAEILFVLCSHDLRVADYAAELYHDGYAPLIVFSGGIAHKGDLVETPWSEPEADVFARRAGELGVPERCMIIEREATNTGENVRFTKRLLESRGIEPSVMIAVQKPYMERRAYATIVKQWPGPRVIVTSPPITYQEYPSNSISREDLINIMVGDLQRVIDYPERGFQIPQEVPADVLSAFEELIRRGYDKHLIRS